MRIATLIIGLLVGVMLVFQTMIAGTFSPEGSETSGAAAGGFVMALLWLLGSALVIGFPKASMWLFGISALIGLFTPTGAFADLRFHGVVAVVLTVMAFFGHRGKKHHDEEVAAEKARQMQRDAMLERMMRSQMPGGSAPVGTAYAPSTTSSFSAVVEPTQSNVRPKWMTGSGSR